VGIVTVVFDCHDPYALARFWAEALDYEPSAGVDDWPSLQRERNAGELEWLRLVDRGTGVAVAFQRVPEDKAVKNRVHLDLRAVDVESEASRLERLGASRLRRSDDPEDVFIVLADPEGNEFCVVLAARPDDEPAPG
jgi:predicted enzyme related to lactoylglutathione lyase